jgi:hypothetical protein
MGVKKEAKNTEEKETEVRAEVVNKEEEEDDDVEFLFEVIIIGDDEEEEVKEEVEEEGKEGDREKKEERNEECEEVASAQRHYYLTMFFLSQLKENSGSICVAHAMHGMRLIGILRCANGGTLEWGKGTRKGEQKEEDLVEFMKSMLGQMSDYYARIQNKLRKQNKLNKLRAVKS